MFTKKPNDVVVSSGDTARFECSATGSPTPMLSWKKDGGDNFPAATERRMHVMPTDDVFFIVNAKVQDTGLYTCFAKSSAGTVKAEARLYVNGNFWPKNQLGINFVWVFFVFRRLTAFRNNFDKNC